MVKSNKFTLESREAEKENRKFVANALIAALVTAYIYANQVQVDRWFVYLTSFIYVFVEIAVAFGAIVVLKRIFAGRHVAIAKLLILFTWSALVFSSPEIVYFDFSSNWLTVFCIWAFEVIFWLTTSGGRIFKSAAWLDGFIFIALVVFSAVFAAIINSTEFGLKVQPIPIDIELQRNIENFPRYLAYWIQLVVIYAIAFIYFLFNRHYLVKRIFVREGVFSYLMWTLLTILMFTPILSELMLLLPINRVEQTLLPSGDNNAFSHWNVQFAMWITILSTPFLIAIEYQKQKLSLSLIREQSINNELKWLQQQINPHFLFNTLNNIYSTSITSEQETPEMILKFSNLMRYVVYQGGKDFTAVDDDLEHLRNYIEINKIRVSQRAEITYDIQVDQKLKICPLLLITFVENAFKHGIDATADKSWLTLSIKNNGTTLFFECRNSLPDIQLSSHVSGGLGLINIERRLALQYPDKYQLNYAIEEQEFVAKLILELSYV